MNKKITWLLILLMLMNACTFNASSTKEVRELEKSKMVLAKKQPVPSSFFPDPLQIVSIGDSLTQGIGDSTDNGGYLPYLQSHLEKKPEIRAAELSNYGVKGNRSDQLLKRLEKKEMKKAIKQADTVIITIGGNDVMKVVRKNITNLKMKQFTTERKKYEKRLMKIIDEVRSLNNDAPIYLIGIYNPFSKWLNSFKELDIIMKDWNNSSEDIITGYKDAYFIPIDDIFKNPKEDLLYSEDYFHPNDKGYELIAAKIFLEMEGNSIKEELAIERDKEEEE